MIRDIIVIDDLAAEPLSLTEAKEYLHVDFTQSDSLLATMIVGARKRLERFTGVSFGSKTLEVYADIDGSFELPYGPVGQITSVQLLTGDSYEDYTDYTVIGERFKSIHPRRKGTYRIVYTTVNSVDGDLLMALMAEVAYRFENRGDVNAAKLSDQAKELAMPYRRISTTL